MIDSNRRFCGLMLKRVRKDLISLIPSGSLKGLWTWRSSNQIGSNRFYEVHIPENRIFPNGYFWSGQALNSSDAKVQAFTQITDRIEHNIKDERYPINL